jgi:hypothetical protein
MSELRDYQKKAIEAALEGHISAGRIHPRWRSVLPDLDSSPAWARSLRAKLDDADRARDGEIIVDEAQKLRTLTKDHVTYDPGQATITINGKQIPGRFSITFPPGTITLPGRVEGKVTCAGTISLDEPRCECGSGSNLAGPWHSDYCKLLKA